MNDGRSFQFDVVGVGANSVDYVYRVPRFPLPHGPAAKQAIAAHLVTCGGQTATALCTCAAMGLRTKYVGAIGNDANGARMRAELARRGVDVEHACVRDAPSPYAVIVLDDRAGERVVLWHRDPALRLRPEEIDASIIGRTRLLHVDDADEEAAIGAARCAGEMGVPVTSDIERVSSRTEELVAAVSVPIFAERVPEALTGEEDVERALRVIQTRRPGPVGPGGSRRTRPTYESGLVCVTLGARGAMLLSGDRLYHEPALRVSTVDTTGAGDVFRGAFIVALLRGDGPADILRFAVAAAALSCTRVGAMAGIPTVSEVEAVTKATTPGSSCA
ncbi:MAG: hypothetical protein A3J29_22950 [Acidobacteria bacterium RIFCSPLOWO2_12_FULL_67_14b]|nr:MAG: hypothetical protein A3I61_13650 [Acidobacteria bacterium RIFCSPLOWO2_02_FULL_68_18]OFW45370.1 MAG: hypothetical protein A3J29_22950 [Acidobacteria bacterium RIFCSPLOWO2_12_FULL_67_14b]